MLYAGNLSAVTDLFASAPLNTDDRPLIEFLAPRLTRVAATFGNADWFTGENLASFYRYSRNALGRCLRPALAGYQGNYRCSPGRDSALSLRRRSGAA